MIRRRTKPRRGQPTKAEKSAIWDAVYERAEGKCELRLHKQCSGARVLPRTGELLFKAHLVHLKSRGAGGTWTMENCRLGCAPCHNGSMHTEGKKPIFLLTPEFDGA